MFFSRGKNKVQHPYTFADMYKDYIKDKPKDSPYYVTYHEYVTICSMFYRDIAKAIIERGIKFKMPGSLGSVYILKQKLARTSKLPIDWQLTVKAGKRVYNLNEHTGGFNYKIFWTKPYRLVHKYMYRLVFTRQNKRYLAKLIKQKKIDFFER